MLLVCQPESQFSLSITREYPNELRWRVWMLSNQGRSTQDIVSSLCVGKSFVKKIKTIQEYKIGAIPLANREITDHAW